jgi:hypothetical protein
MICSHRSRARLAIDPRTVVALVRARRPDVRRRFGLVNQLDFAVGFHRAHEFVGDADRDVEVGEIALVLRVDEGLDVGMIATKHAHLRAAARTRGFHRLARTVEHAHVRHRSTRARLRAVDHRALRADGREVVAHAAAAAHGLGSFRERGIDARTAVDHFGDRVAHRLDEAVDQRGRERGTGGGIDAACGDEALHLGFEEALFPVGAAFLGFSLSQSPGDALPDFLDGALAALGVFLQEDLAGDLLGGEGGRRLDVGGRGGGVFHDRPEVHLFISGRRGYAFESGGSSGCRGGFGLNPGPQRSRGGGGRVIAPGFTRH